MTSTLLWSCWPFVDPVISFTQQSLILKFMNLPRCGLRGNYICQSIGHVLVLLSQQGSVTQPDADVCVCVSVYVCVSLFKQC